MKRLLKQTPGFTRSVRRLVKRQPEIGPALQDTLILLAEDVFAARLHTHKLKGDLAGSWSCSVAYDLRIVFDLVTDSEAEIIYLLAIGTHDEVY